MGKFDRAQAALIRRNKAANPREVTVTRGAEVFTLTGWFGRGLMVSTADGGARIEISEREFFFTVADYARTPTGTGPGVPDIGDRFLVTGEAITWEVMTPDTGEPAARYSDAERTIWRVHTKVA